MPARPLGLCLLFALLAASASAQFVVTNTLDIGAGSLRQAILDSNACLATCDIEFNILAGSCPSSECRIEVASALPSISGIGSPTVDGTTQQIFNGSFVVVDGNGIAADGLTLAAASVTVDGLAVVAFGGAGIRLTSPAGGAEILSSRIGTSFAGSVEGNGGDGIAADSGLLGALISGNTIAHNGGSGVRIGTDDGDLTPSGVELISNSIFDNALLGIDLGTQGVLANDALDLDAGPNGLQNAPVLTSASSTPSGIQVVGQLESETSQDYRIEIYGSAVADPSGFGEGEILLNSFNAATDASGVAPIDQVFFASGSSFDSITATATKIDLSGGVNETSEFSNAVPLPHSYIVTNTNDSGLGSLRAAIDAANSFACAYPCTILFNIPGTGPVFTIQPLTPLPAIVVEQVFIEGSSQTSFGGDTNPFGPEIDLDGSLLSSGHGLLIDAASTFVGGVGIEGLTIRNFPGDGIRVDAPGSFSSSGNAFFNCYIGTDPTGTSASPNGGYGIGLFGAALSNFVGDPFNDIGNLISGNAAFGVYAGISSGSHIVVSNLIGTDRTATSPIPNGMGGVYVDSGFNQFGFFSSRFIVNSAGASALSAPADPSRRLARLAERDPASDERIASAPWVVRQQALAASRSSAPAVAPSSVAAQGALPAPSGNIIAFNDGPGIVLDNGASENLVALNWIHSNDGDGVLLTGTAGNGNWISVNSIHDNAGLGIDIDAGTQNADGVTQNDGAETFGEPNDLVDYPTIVSAVFDGTNTDITYTFASTSGAYQTYYFDFHKGPTPDPSGFGEGETWFDFDAQTYGITPPDGTTPHLLRFPMDLRGNWITATTGSEVFTSTSFSVSEFSAAVAVQALDLGIAKSGPATVLAGQPFSYTLTVTNFGPDTSEPVDVTDTLPAGTAFVSASASSSTPTIWSCSETSPGVVLCTTGVMLELDVTTITINVVAPGSPGTITNTADVATGGTDIDPANDFSAVSTTVLPPEADLKIEKSGPASVQPGQSFSWTLVVTNLGPESALDLGLNDVLPGGVTSVSFSAPGWTCAFTPSSAPSSAGSLSCFRPSLAAGVSSSITIQVTAPNGSATLTNTADVFSETTDSNQANNGATAVTVVEDPCTVGRPISVSPVGETAGPPVEFVFEAVAEATGYQIILIGPDGVSRQLASISGSAPAGEQMRVTVESGIPSGRNIWFARALFKPPCRTVDGNQLVFFIDSCPTAVPELLEPAGGVVNSPTTVFRWTRVDEATRYDLFTSLDGGGFVFAGSVNQPADPNEVPSLELAVPAGAAIGWFVEVFFGPDCPVGRSATEGFDVACFAPVLSVPGELSSGEPYQVRATIVSVGRGYEFQESTSPDFDENLVVRDGIVDESGEFIFAEFEHEIVDATAFFYRVRVAQTGCQFSDPPGRIVIIPISLDSVAQFGFDSPISRALFVPSPDPDSELSFNFVATTDRDWLTVQPNSGIVGPEGVTLTVVIDPVDLPVGSTIGTVLVEFTEVGASGKSAQSNHTTTTSTSVSLTLVTPVTNTGKSGPVAESLVIPAVAHAGGVASAWRTDVRLINLGTSVKKYALNLTESGQDGTQSGKTSEIQLAPGQITALNDVVKHWYGIGSLPGESGTGTLEIRPLDAAGKTAAQTPVTRTLVSLASSRTYNQTTTGTLGQFIPAIPFAAFVGQTPPEAEQRSVLSLQQLAQSTDYRTNVGVVEAAGKSATVTMRFFDAAGVELFTLPVTLQPGEHRQFDQILAKNGVANVASARAELEVTGGDGKIAAYASVIDNRTGDPLLVQAVDLATLGAQKYVVPGVAHFETGQANWRSDLQLFNAGLASVRARLAFFRQQETTAAQTVEVDLEPGTVTALNDILQNTFGESNSGGAVHVTTDVESRLVITGRTYDQQEDGTFGQFISAVTEEQAIGLGDRPMQVLQMEESAKVRTNLGLVEVTGQPVLIEITAHPAESRVSPTIQLNLAGNEFRQLNQVLRILNAGTTYNARVSLRVIGGNGRIAAYGSAIDNSTQDPTYVPGQ
ncbi:MAG TPA: hypothetical protein VMS56_03760 [Thermoanaerobaculia bacterium]|nr:hypothetical protein [Thermoanaerobaculia bacterium]